MLHGLAAGMLGRDLGGERRRLARALEALRPDDDQAIVLPCASVIVIIVLLNVAFTCATPEMMFLRSRRRTRAPVAALPSRRLQAWP